MHDGNVGDAILLFDGVCGFCNASIAFVLQRSWGRPLRFCPMQSPAGEAMLRRLGLPLDNPQSLILVEDGEVRIRTAAVLRLAGYMEPPWPSVAAVLRWVPHRVGDWLYDRVAANRFRIAGRRQPCMVPDAAVRERFLE